VLDVTVDGKVIGKRCHWHGAISRDCRRAGEPRRHDAAAFGGCDCAVTEHGIGWDEGTSQDEKAGLPLGTLALGFGPDDDPKKISLDEKERHIVLVQYDGHERLFRADKEFFLGMVQFSNLCDIPAANFVKEIWEAGAKLPYAICIALTMLPMVSEKSVNQGSFATAVDVKDDPAPEVKAKASKSKLLIIQAPIVRRFRGAIEYKFINAQGKSLGAPFFTVREDAWLKLGEDLKLAAEDYKTVACPRHRNMFARREGSCGYSLYTRCKILNISYTKQVAALIRVAKCQRPLACMKMWAEQIIKMDKIPVDDDWQCDLCKNRSCAGCGKAMPAP